MVKWTWEIPFLSSYHPKICVKSNYQSRLLNVIDSLISITQTTFIRGPNIFYGWISTSEVVDFMKKNMSGLIFKLNFEKAYDHVNWEFLRFIMHWMRFEERWIKWIQRCISCATISIPVNGTSGPNFDMEFGLRQDYPLGCFLFGHIYRNSFNFWTSFNIYTNFIGFSWYL